MFVTKQVRIQRLKKIRIIATSLLILVTLLFIGSKIGNHYIVWKGWEALIAFSEAAMVGALADWFAVVALFHHPMGLPIPHTNLVVRNQVKLGENMGEFVTNNFLSEKTLKDKISQIKVSSFLIKWLGKHENKELLRKYIHQVFTQIVQHLDVKSIEKFIENNAFKILQKIEPVKTVKKLGDYVFEKQVHQALLTEVLKLADTYVKQNEDFISKQIKQNAKIIPNFLNDIITAKIVEIVEKNLEDIIQNPEHSVRMDFDTFILKWIGKIETEPQYTEKAILFRDELIQKIDLQRQSEIIYQTLIGNIEQQLADEKSGFNQKIMEILLKSLDSDDLKNKIDVWVQEKVLKIIVDNKNAVSDHISQTVHKWDKTDLSDKLELAIGSDLQFIRINGTLVGGCIGLVLYLVFEVIFKL